MNNKKMTRVLGPLVLLSATFLASAKPGSHFDYSLSGQQSWLKNYPQCSGHSQSPITIAASRSIPLPLPALELIGYHDLLIPPLTLRNNGHTVVLKIKDESIRKRTPYIFGALLNENERYELESLHFHWGVKNRRGSEHVLHGTRYPMEMHLVHRNTKYKDIESALKQKDGLAALAVFFHLEEQDNQLLQPLLIHLPEIQAVNSEIRLNGTLKLSSLLPVDLDTYYTYRGSLTTPPCSEVVTWIVFPSSVAVSFNQMSRFRLLSSGKKMLADNFRQLQDIRNRKIYVRRADAVFASKNEIVDLDLKTLKWQW